MQLDQDLPGYWAATGHRPDKLGGYSPSVETQLVFFAIEMLDEIEPKGMIVGMALGWDMAVAEACYLLGIPYHAYVPFVGQESKWPSPSRHLYVSLCSKALEYVVVSDGSYAVEKMQIRNRAMVDAAGEGVLALWNGTPGGTANCVKYAQLTAGKPMTNVWERWLEWQRTHS